MFCVSVGCPFQIGSNIAFILFAPVDNSPYFSEESRDISQSSHRTKVHCSFKSLAKANEKVRLVQDSGN